MIESNCPKGEHQMVGIPQLTEMTSKRYKFQEVTTCLAMAFVLSCIFSESAHAVQRMGIAAGTTILQPRGSDSLRSRCLDEHAPPPTTASNYTQVLSDNPEDITVEVGNAPPIPFDQAVKEMKIRVTGESSRTDFSIVIHFMKLKNLTNERVIVRVARFTPIGTRRHRPMGYDVSRFRGMGQQEIWDLQSKEEPKWRVERRQRAKEEPKRQEVRRQREEEESKRQDERRQREEEERKRQEEERPRLTDDDTVYVSGGDNSFHRASCEHLRNRRSEGHKRGAVKSVFAPCGDCKP